MLKKIVIIVAITLTNCSNNYAQSPKTDLLFAKIIYELKKINREGIPIRMEIINSLSPYNDIKWGKIGLGVEDKKAIDDTTIFYKVTNSEIPALHFIIVESNIKAFIYSIEQDWDLIELNYQYKKHVSYPFEGFFLFQKSSKTLFHLNFYNQPFRNIDATLDQIKSIFLLSDTFDLKSKVIFNNNEPIKLCSYGKNQGKKVKYCQKIDNKPSLNLSTMYMSDIERLLQEDKLSNKKLIIENIDEEDIIKLLLLKRL